MKNGNWLTTENNLFVYRQLQQNAVKNGEEFACTCCLFTLSFGTPVTSGWGRRWGKSLLSAVAQCSLVERHHYRWVCCLYLAALMEARFLWKFGACLPDRTASQEDNVEENIISIKMQEDPLHDNMYFTRDLNQGLCHVTLQYAVLWSAWKAYNYRGQCRSL